MLLWKVMKTGHLVKQWRKSIISHCDITDIEEFQEAMKYIWSQTQMPNGSNDTDIWFNRYMTDLEIY